MLTESRFRLETVPEISMGPPLTAYRDPSPIIRLINYARRVADKWIRFNLKSTRNQHRENIIKLRMNIEEFVRKQFNHAAVHLVVRRLVGNKTVYLPRQRHPRSGAGFRQDLNLCEIPFPDLNRIGNEPRTRFRFTSVYELNALCDHRSVNLHTYQAIVRALLSYHGYLLSSREREIVIQAGNTLRELNNDPSNDIKEDLDFRGRKKNATCNSYVCLNLRILKNFAMENNIRFSKFLNS